MAKRDIFGELMEGAAAMKSHREGKLTLRSYKVAALRRVLVNRSCSTMNSSIFQAAALVLLVRRYPDTLAPWTKLRRAKRCMRIPRRSRLVVSWIRSGREPNRCDLCTSIAELNPLLRGWGSTTNAPTSESSSKVSTAGR